MEGIDLLIYSLATWRVASLFVDETGPGRMFQHIRELAGMEHDENGVTTIIPDTFFAGVLSCVWCASLWIAAFWIGFDLAWHEAAVRCAAVFAVSGGAVMVKRVLQQENSHS